MERCSRDRADPRRADSLSSASSTAAEPRVHWRPRAPRAYFADEAYGYPPDYVDALAAAALATRGGALTGRLRGRPDTVALSPARTHSVGGRFRRRRAHAARLTGPPPPRANGSVALRRVDFSVSRQVEPTLRRRLVVIGEDRAPLVEYCRPAPNVPRLTATRTRCSVVNEGRNYPLPGGIVPNHWDQFDNYVQRRRTFDVWRPSGGAGGDRRRLASRSRCLAFGWDRNAE